MNETPESEWADDALAELTAFLSEIERNPDSARSVVERLETSYPEGNALDNAFAWLGRGLIQNGDLVAAREVYERIRTRFAGSRFALIASGALGCLSEALEVSVNERSGLPCLRTYGGHPYR